MFSPEFIHFRTPRCAKLHVKAGDEVMGVESIQACSTGRGLVESVIVIGPQNQLTEGNNLTPTLIVEPCFEGFG
jgi:hypothetical protein